VSERESEGTQRESEPSEREVVWGRGKGRGREGKFKSLGFHPPPLPSFA